MNAEALKNLVEATHELARELEGDRSDMAELEISFKFRHLAHEINVLADQRNRMENVAFFLGPKE